MSACHDSTGALDMEKTALQKFVYWTGASNSLQAAVRFKTNNPASY
jgi:hypothetical protein